MIGIYVFHFDTRKTAIFCLGFLPVFLFIFASKPAIPHKIFFDKDILRSEHPDGLIEQVKWDDIQQIDIMTTDAGPWADDAFWVFNATEDGCVFPIDAEGANDNLFDEIESRFPSFNNELFITAMGSTSNQNFTVWDKSQNTDSPNQSAQPLT